MLNAELEIRNCGRDTLDFAYAPLGMTKGIGVSLGRYDTIKGMINCSGINNKSIKRKHGFVTVFFCLLFFAVVFRFFVRFHGGVRKVDDVTKFTQNIVFAVTRFRACGN